MKRLISSLCAILVLFLEVNEPAGFWTFLGGGILLLNFIHFITQVSNEQESN
jgi:hypothetical protein